MKVLTSTLVTIGVAALALPSSAYNLIGPSWPGFNVPMSAAAVSFPVGNAYRTALSTVESRYFFEQPSEGWFTMSYDDPSIGMNNGQNEVWFSSDPSFSPAITFWWSSGSDLVETDIVAYNGLSWTTSADKLTGIAYGGSFRFFEPTMIHEFGHAAGLAHVNTEYNIMGTDWNHIACNGFTTRSYIGEDAADGLVALFGLYSGGDIEDLSVTLFKYLGTSGEYSTHQLCKMYDSSGVELSSSALEGQRRYDVPIGQSVRVEFTYENNGETFQNPAIGFYVSTNNFISTGDQLVYSSSLGLGRADVLTTYHNITLPTNLNVGQTYYLGVLIDNNGVISEATEANNAGYHAFRLTCESVGSQSFYNSGPNPASLSGSLVNIGDPFTLSVNLATTGHTFALPFGFDTPVDITLSGGQHLLCLDLGGSGEVLGFVQKTGPIATFSGNVPSFAYLCGFFFSAQAIHFGGVTPFALSNALDFVVGG